MLMFWRVKGDKKKYDNCNDVTLINWDFQKGPINWIGTEGVNFFEN